MVTVDIKKDKHIFAIFFEPLSALVTIKDCGMVYTITDQVIIHRLLYVLRMENSDFIVLFNTHIACLVSIVMLNKKELIFALVSVNYPKTCSSPMLLYLPLLKRISLEEAVYNATEAGISAIQLIITDRSIQSITIHEFNRLQKIIIAACEQAKQYVLPTLIMPIDLDVALEKAKGQKVWLDSSGISLFMFRPVCQNNLLTHVSIIVGPESDFSSDEKEKIKNSFIPYALTKTTLRSVSAVLLSVGMIRIVLDYAFLQQSLSSSSQSSSF